MASHPDWVVAGWSAFDVSDLGDPDPRS